MKLQVETGDMKYTNILHKNIDKKKKNFKSEGFSAFP